MTFDELVDIIARLRSEQGCPWDKEQTYKSIVPYLMEEVYEIIESIDEGNPSKLKEELGDVLFQLLFFAQISKEGGHFDIYDVVEVIGKKMVFRHPHVFGDAVFETSDEVLRQWEERKKEEGRQSLLSGVPTSAPSLLRAYRIQQRASRVGFDWQKADEVFEQFAEELGEFKKALADKDIDAIEDELGDLLFTLVNLSRFVKVNPENALRRTINRFQRRFEHIEKTALQQGIDLSAMSLEEMNRLWDEAKEMHCHETP
ncbi:MAG: nucleoside triphosphate pyrophosphohydrolase [Nitrospirae bacterium]|uniref:nucleoside triphosphate pyrophosphohydrolase n=1 Tax=Candidatus Magnetobacterium casense TaxID=1455061 RepID=UPI00058DA21F|nr:nucleoside triphosphate pyrophosphohydrolase [Candidatus Magnetobacterium casensis]MBF0338903.1 nucleoside triphosphate pyrophosphohydrolase [Nitrospirota bacterium]